MLAATTRVSGFWSYQVGVGGVLTTTTTSTTTTRQIITEKVEPLIADNSHLYLCAPLYLPRGGEAEEFAQLCI